MKPKPMKPISPADKKPPIGEKLFLITKYETMNIGTYDGGDEILVHNYGYMLLTDIIAYYVEID